MQAKCRLTRMSKQRKNRNCKISSLGQKNNSIRTHKCLPERYGRRVDSSAHCRDSCSAVQMCTPPNSLSTSLSGSSCWDVFLGTPSSRSIFFFRADVGGFMLAILKGNTLTKGWLIFLKLVACSGLSVERSYQNRRWGHGLFLERDRGCAGIKERDHQFTYAICPPVTSSIGNKMEWGGGSISDS